LVMPQPEMSLLFGIWQLIIMFYSLMSWTKILVFITALVTTWHRGAKCL
jgi:hypothetical protein